MKRGEIWWADIPAPIGRRPVLLLSRDKAYEIRSKVTVAPLTTTIRGIDSEATLGPDEGLKRSSVANLDSIMTIPKSLLDQRITSLSRHKIREVDAAIHFALQLAD